MKHFKPRGSGHNNRVRYVYHSAETGKMVKISISHRDGGMNYFSGGTEKRGIEVSVATVEISERTAGSFVETSRPMEDGNARYLIAETPRYNKAKLERIASAMDAELPTLAKTWEDDLTAGRNLLVEIANKAGAQV